MHIESAKRIRNTKEIFRILFESILIDGKWVYFNQVCFRFLLG